MVVQEKDEYGTLYKIVINLSQNASLPHLLHLPCLLHLLHLSHLPHLLRLLHLHINALCIPHRTTSHLLSCQHSNASLLFLFSTTSLISYFPQETKQPEKTCALESIN